MSTNDIGLDFQDTYMRLITKSNKIPSERAKKCIAFLFKMAANTGADVAIQFDTNDAHQLELGKEVINGIHDSSNERDSLQKTYGVKLSLVRAWNETGMFAFALHSGKKTGYEEELRNALHIDANEINMKQINRFELPLPRVARN
ncbi:MAG: hypothetical protein KDJ35_06310 [Alphaproteobacteria bacterium]|nr:hypothetical protein [Alphaproteobacteria bacterium]